MYKPEERICKVTWTGQNVPEATKAEDWLSDSGASAHIAGQDYWFVERFRMTKPIKI